MHIGVFHVNAAHNSDPAVVAKKAEDFGFESYWVGDHTVVPVQRTGQYPGVRPGEDVPEYLFRLADPLIALARASAVTTRLKLGTGVCLVPERNPILLALQFASLDNMSGGRTLMGIGGGWCPEECAVMGGDFEHRWTQIKDYVAAMKTLWRDDPAEYHGKYVDFPPVRAFPKPAQQPYPPILLGAIDNPRSHRRVAEWADGWMPVLLGDTSELQDGIDRVRQLAAEYGRDPDAIDFTVFGAPGQHRSTEECRELERTGCQRVVVWLQEYENHDIARELEDLASNLL